MLTTHPKTAQNAFREVHDRKRGTHIRIHKPNACSELLNVSLSGRTPLLPQCALRGEQGMGLYVGHQEPITLQYRIGFPLVPFCYELDCDGCLTPGGSVAED